MQEELTVDLNEYFHNDSTDYWKLSERIDERKTKKTTDKGSHIFHTFLIKRIVSTNQKKKRPPAVKSLMTITKYNKLITLNPDV